MFLLVQTLDINIHRVYKHWILEFYWIYKHLITTFTEFANIEDGTYFLRCKHWIYKLSPCSLGHWNLTEFTYVYLALDRSELFGYILHPTLKGTFLIYSGLYLNPQILLRGTQLLGNEQPM